MPKVKLFLLWLSGAIFLGVWFPFFSAQVRPSNDSWSDCLVTNALLNASGVGTVPKSLLGTSLPFKTGSTEELLDNLPNETYKSAFGLQGYLAVWTWKALGQPALAKSAKVSRVLYSFILGGLLLLFAWDIRRSFGGAAYGLCLLLITSSLFIANFGRSLHWQGWLIFAPFVYGWIMYPKHYENGTLMRYYGAIVGLVFLRSLVGYEFLSNIAVALMIKPFLFHHSRGDLVSAWKKIVTSSIAITTVGFIGAAAVHISALSSEVGGPLAAVNHIKSRVSDRMSNQLTGEDAEAVKKNPPTFASTTKKYLKDYGMYMIPTGVCIPVGLYFLGQAWKKRKMDGLEGFHAQQEVIMLSLGAIATFSWAVLMRNHMIVGIVHNPIIFFLPFYFMVAVVLARRIGALSQLGELNGQLPQN